MIPSPGCVLAGVLGYLFQVGILRQVVRPAIPVGAHGRFAAVVALVPVLVLIPVIVIVCGQVSFDMVRSSSMLMRR